jgi:hypothetical protein
MFFLSYYYSFICVCIYLGRNTFGFQHERLHFCSVWVWTVLATTNKIDNNIMNEPNLGLVTTTDITLIWISIQRILQLNYKNPQASIGIPSTYDIEICHTVLSCLFVFDSDFPAFLLLYLLINKSFCLFVLNE